MSGVGGRGAESTIDGGVAGAAAEVVCAFDRRYWDSVGRERSDRVCDVGGGGEAGDCLEYAGGDGGAAGGGVGRDFAGLGSV